MALTPIQRDLVDGFDATLLEWITKGRPKVTTGYTPVLDEHGQPIYRKLMDREMIIVLKRVTALDALRGPNEVSNTLHDEARRQVASGKLKIAPESKTG